MFQKIKSMKNKKNRFLEMTNQDNYLQKLKFRNLEKLNKTYYYKKKQAPRKNTFKN